MAYRSGSYTADHKGMADYLKSKQLARAVKHVADDIADTARSLAPTDTGEYAQGITVERVENAGINGDRVGYEVAATAGHPTLVEWGRKPGNGSRGYEGQHVMRRAAESVGE